MNFISSYLSLWLCLWALSLLKCLLLLFLGLKKDVKRERQHNDLIQGVNNFSVDKLKRTDTLEKVILPNAQGKFALLFFKPNIAKKSMTYNTIFSHNFVIDIIYPICFYNITLKLYLVFLHERTSEKIV